jgi:MATE family multidrug resistance protein
MADKSPVPSPSSPQLRKTELGADQNLAVDETSLRYMLKLAIPMIVSTISFTVMQFVDRYMVSRLGTTALAAILPAQFVSFLPTSFAIGSIAILNTFVSQSLGRGSKSDCSNYFWQVIYLGFVYFLAVLAIMWPTAALIFRAMGQPAAVADLEVVYFRIMLYAHILAIVNYAGSQFFMGVHRPIITMYASVCGQVVNVAANYVLIFGKLGFPAMGISGAGWGTFIGIGIAAVINTAMFLSSSINATFKSRHTLGIDFGKMQDLLKVGLPAGLGLMVNVAIWGVILFALVGKVDGQEALAATSAVLSYTSFAIMPIVGMATALTAAVGKAIGRGTRDLAIRQTSVCMRVALVYMGLVGLCFLMFRNTLMEFWSADSAVIHSGAKILVFAAVYVVFHATRIIYSGSLQGAGDTLWLAMISAVGAVVILGIGGAIIAALLPSLGALGPWAAATASIIMVGLANWWRFKTNRWMKIDLFKRRAVSVPAEI